MRAPLFAVLLVLPACADELGPEPVALVLSAMPGELDPGDDLADDLTIVVRYEDGDADLGGGRALVHDCRADDLVTALDLPPIASEQAIATGVPIRGELSLTVTDVGVVPAAAAAPAACADLGAPAPTADAAIFCVVLEDAAGHQGPGDCTDPIAITGS